jgi:hypothetical protein
MRLARWIYGGAGLYGLMALFPLYFLEGWFGQEYPPEVNHAELYYGFVGIGVAWQVLFLLLATDPIRYRPLMPATFLEKATYGFAFLALYRQGRAPAGLLPPALMDLVLLALFVVAYWKCPRTQSGGGGPV